MKTPILLRLFLALQLTLSLSLTAQKKQSMSLSLENYLSVNYSYENRSQHDNAYYAHDTLRPIHDATLNTLYPDIALYHTQFRSTYMEYVSVEVIVAVRKSNSSDVHILWAPSFNSSSPDFHAMFYGKNISKNDMQQKFTTAYSNLYKLIVPDAIITKDTGSNKLEIKYKISSGLAATYTLCFSCDSAGALTKISFEH